MEFETEVPKEDTELDSELAWLNKPVRCGYCEDKGVIYAYSVRNHNDGMYVFKCDCKGGPPWLLDRKFPYWGSKSGYINSRLQLPPHPVAIWAELDKSEGKSDIFKDWIAQWGRNRLVAHFKIWKAERDGKKTNKT